MADPDKKKKKGDSGDGNGNGDGGDPKGQQKQVSMTQEALDNIIKDRVDRAKNSAVSGLLAEVELEDIDGLKTALTEWTQIKDDQKTELEKIQGDLDTTTTRAAELEGELEKEKDRAKMYMLRSSVISAARDADFLKESLEDVWLLVSTTEDLSSKLSVNGEKVEGANDIVKKVAEMRPHWVEQKQHPGTPPPRGSGSPAPKRKQTEPEGPLVRF